MDSSRGRCEQPPPPGTDWAALPHDVLATVFLKLGMREVMRGAGFACKSWMRVALQEPALWRRIEMTTIRRSSRGWRDMVSAAVERSAGQCVAFSGPCDNQSLIHLVGRAPRLQSLDLFDYVACNDVLIESISRLHLLEDLEISPAYKNCSEDFRMLFRPVCRACPRLKRLVMGYQVLMRGIHQHVGEELALFPVMDELQYLELFSCELSPQALSAILDSCPRLESLHILGSFPFPRSRTMRDELRLKCAAIMNLTLPGIGLR